MSKPFEPWRPRSRLIAARWVCVIAYGVLGAFGALVLSLLLAPVLAGLSSGLAAMGIAGHVVIAALTLFLVGYLIVKLSLFRPAYLKNLSIHPPLLVSVLIGVCILMVMQGYPLCAYAGVTAFLLFSACLVLGVVSRRGAAIEPPQELSLQGIDVPSWGEREITEWMNIESPVAKADLLLFNREEYVNRIYKSLFPQKENIESEGNTLALLGEMGSGKTSVLNILIQQLEVLRPDYLVLSVDSWERNPSTVDEQVLEIVIDKLAEHIDVTGYRSLPSNYHNALQSHGGWWSMLSHLFGQDAQAEDKLQSIFNLLDQLNKKLLIIIEDPDRGVKPDVEKRCQRIFSLIDRLQRIKSNRVKVIVTGGLSLHDGDLRVIEYKEELANPASDYAAIINKLLEKRWDLEAPQEEGEPAVWSYHKPHFEAEGLDLGTPRDFKHVLREIDFLWRDTELRGEINLEQLIFLSFAKQRSYLIFGYVIDILEKRQENQSCSVYGWARSPDRGFAYIPQKVRNQAAEEEVPDKNLIKEVTAELNKIASAVGHVELSSEEKSYANNIVSRILAVKGRQCVTDTSRIHYLESIQKKHRVRPLQYEDALLGVVLKPVEQLRDQEYLKAMRDIFNALSSNPASPDLKSENIQKLINCGPLSDYLYCRMRGDDRSRYQGKGPALAPIAWVKLAKAIIEQMTKVEYTRTEWEHPAGVHLLTIAQHLVDKKENKSVKEIIDTALQAPCSAGAEFLYCVDTREDVLSNLGFTQVEQWSLYRQAILNPFIIPRNIPEDGKAGDDEISWRFIQKLQQLQPETCQNWVRAWEENSGSRFQDDEENLAAINRLDELFRQLDSFKLELRPEPMLPIELNAKYFFMSGIREQQDRVAAHRRILFNLRSELDSEGETD